MKQRPYYSIWLSTATTVDLVTDYTLIPYLQQSFARYTYAEKAPGLLGEPGSQLTLPPEIPSVAVMTSHLITLQPRNH